MSSRKRKSTASSSSHSASQTKRLRDEPEEAEEKFADPWPVWQEIYFIGHEYETYQDLFTQKWDFSHLKEALESDVGPIADQVKQGKQVYIWGQTEGVERYSEDGSVGAFPVPFFAVCCSSLPPTEEIVTTSVQGGESVPRSFAEERCTWQPFFRKETLGDRRPVVSFYALHTLLRLSTIAKWGEEEIRRLDYRQVYVRNPLREIPPLTSVDFDYELDPNDPEKGSLMCAYNTEIDDSIEACCEEVLEDNDHLDMEYHLPRLIEFAKKAWEKAKTEREEQIRELAEWRATWPARVEAFKNMKIFKFYPCNYEQSRPCYINRYFGKAKPEDVFPPSTDGQPKKQQGVLTKQ
eukprot:CAMPEP_0177649742 /NCGR_PEP_ID=MMETSP0447-20121125/11557_1 /TAXON_ID=0 /ORGANISM="Stygamoeba regulata, Strain BSH-02190019" /LENGTH=349 /DNA_ID=CAMNT_0019152537 /DNA_START=60 /DNA_END=1109 /DNA_ORIENTATION=+